MFRFGFLMIALSINSLNSFPLSTLSTKLAFRALTTTTARKSNSFDLIGDELQHALSNKLGILAPNEVQNSSLPLALQGQDVFIIAQTGSGKTLTFLLPILHRLQNMSGRSSSASITDPDASQTKQIAIVIGPTTELLAQHAATAAKLAPSLVSHMLFKTPHQLSSDLDNQLLDIDDIKVVAIDEVDAVLCGTEFNKTIPESSVELLDLLPDQGTPRCQYILTTAHLTSAHTQVLNHLFPKIKTIRQNGDTKSVLVPTLRQNFHYFSGDISSKLDKLKGILEKADINNPALLVEHSTIIFCKDETEVELVHSFLQDSPSLNNTFQPRKLHINISPNERTDALSAFQAQAGDNTDTNTCRLLVTHEICARGLDCPSVRHVILFDTPTDVTAFVHRAGRTARAGEEGVVTCLVQAGFGTSFGGHKDLHALKDAPKLKFEKNTEIDE